jgi:hypothetical protein
VSHVPTSPLVATVAATIDESFCAGLSKVTTHDCASPVLYCIVLCCVVLCCVVLCCVVLCCVVLCCVVLCCVVLRCVVLRCVVLCCVGVVRGGATLHSCLPYFTTVLCLALLPRSTGQSGSPTSPCPASFHCKFRRCCSRMLLLRPLLTLAGA